MWILSWSTAATGSTPMSSDWTSSVTSPWRPEASYLWRQIRRFQYPATLSTPRVHQAWASPKFSFFSAWIADGRLTYLPVRPTYVTLPTYRDHLLHSYRHHRHRAIVIVRPLFKRNIYLFLLCDWIILFVYKINFFSFSSKYAVEACDMILIPTADRVHFSSHAS